MAHTNIKRDAFLKEMVLKLDQLGIYRAKLKVHSFTPDEYKVKIKKFNHNNV